MMQFAKINDLPGLDFDTSYARLPDRFYANIHAREARAPKLVKLNMDLARELGLDTASLDPEKVARILSGNGLPDDGTLLAMAYSGHQFGHFNPGLGDGRAGLIGEVIDVNGRRRDIQLKGSGPTPFSRNGDGLAALGPVMREYILSEAMAALGVPTTRSLAIILTGDFVYREQMLPGAVLTRVADSHLRIGTFQYFAARGDAEGLSALADYAIDRHYPELASADNPPLALLEKVIDQQAFLIARWMGIGFIHGVMNTDNMTISGETIDYGPCAFMDGFDHNRVFSSIDQNGRYAYGAQPQMAQWNLARLAETLIPLMDKNEDAAIASATRAVHAFSGIFAAHWQTVMGNKLGLYRAEGNGADNEKTTDAIRAFLTLLQKHGADFTSAFSALTKSPDNGFDRTDLKILFNADPEFDQWFENWHRMIEAFDADQAIDHMKSANPVYIPRNHLVEEAIRAGEDSQDFSVMESLLEAVLNPFEERDGFDRFALPPKPGEEITQTFCGT